MSFGETGRAEGLGVRLRGWGEVCFVRMVRQPVSSRPRGGLGEAGRPGVGLRGGGGSDRRTPALPSGGGRGADVTISSAQGPADDPEVVSTGLSCGRKRQAVVEGPRRGRGGGPLGLGVWATADEQDLTACVKVRSIGPGVTTHMRHSHAAATAIRHLAGTAHHPGPISQRPGQGAPCEGPPLPCS